jgi:hypothetical protein
VSGHLERQLLFVSHLVKNHAIINFATAHYLILASAGLADVWLANALEKAIPGMKSDPTIAANAVRLIMIACIWIFRCQSA